MIQEIDRMTLQYTETKNVFMIQEIDRMALQYTETKNLNPINKHIITVEQSTKERLYNN